MAQQTTLATNSQPRNQADYRPVADFAPSLWKDMNVFTTKLSHSVTVLTNVILLFRYSFSV